jgi:heme oxygenase
MPLKRLKAATQPAHERLERSLALFETVRTLPEYRGYLRRFYQMLSALEPRLAAESARHGYGHYFPARSKMSWLREDLLALGDRVSDLEALPPPTRMPDLTHREAWLGTMYVVEGSSLGAQVISAHYEKQLGLSARHGMRFFQGYGAATGLRWQEFCADLRAELERSPATEAAITQAATAAFGAFEACLVPEAKRGAYGRGDG